MKRPSAAAEPAAHERPRRVLLVDDDEDFLRLLCVRLEREGYEVATAAGGAEALSLIQGVLPDVVVSDLRMDGMDGIELLDRLQRGYPSLPVLLITAHGTIPEAVAATQHGAVGFITKPVEGSDLLEKIRAAIGLYGRASDDDAEALGTRNDRMRKLLASAQAAARSDSAVLIQGETGSGKEVLARYVHRMSPRRDGPWVTVNCTAIPEHLLESELFGHVKGAFTGATGHHLGLVRAAHGGTLFLDEIGDMPMGLQTKLLRVLEDRLVRPVGSTAQHEVDLRLISATHRDLDQAIAAQTFRADLYYRLNVLRLELPALAERREDIPLLVQRFLAELTREGERRLYAPEAMELLVRFDWPGNVRQLRNVVERNVALSPAVVISREQVQDALGADVPDYPSFDEARDSFTREYLAQLLKIADGNVAQAARLAQRNRTDFYKLLNRYRIDREPGDD